MSIEVQARSDRRGHPALYIFDDGHYVEVPFSYEIYHTAESLEKALNRLQQLKDEEKD